MKSDWKKRKRHTRLAKANGFNHYHQYREYVKYSVKLDGLTKRCMCDEKPSFYINFTPFIPEHAPVAQVSEFVNKFMECLVKETWCTETYCDDDDLFDCLKEDNEDDEF